MNLAIFDLDHTLINCDSSSEWSNFLHEKGIFSDADMQRHQAFDQDYRKGCLDLDAYLAFVLRPLAVPSWTKCTVSSCSASAQASLKWPECWSIATATRATPCS